MRPIDDIQRQAVDLYRASDISLKNTTFDDIIKPKGRVIRLKIHGVKREWSRPFWVRFKKHHCPTCLNLLTTTTVSKIVNSNSEEAKNYDFSSSIRERKMQIDSRILLHEKSHFCLLTKVTFFNDIRSLRNG